MGFSAEHAKELKISNRTIKIDVQNDEMTLAADSKLFDELEVVWWKKASIRHVSGETMNKQPRWRAPRNSRQQTRLRTAAMVMKLAYVAQDRVASLKQ